MTPRPLRGIYTPGQKRRPGVGVAKNGAFAPLFNAWVRHGTPMRHFPPTPALPGVRGFSRAHQAAPVCLRRLTPFNKYGARMALQNGVSRRKTF
ncbi:hypothetical protein NDU88_006884 [Pleurodeles waltl]|uniref:Uncharacterized protein n=1 Tax=Pleurodeles waltl TaxID=8319 RepID=A0AAV7VI31_PLEWA|nr:hypothetical protein NDU88_003160 [Pleurodeles waltl]KAJ1117747.1 hypothetical protein NDU88_005944 [Pleurodeles waltl]KAJ1200556.1 hypothetical protein NDU88_004379 [Pleurodeles waltl]KAJ1200557.1 hypothetical protein NDU88_004380 [Pleurodeles waltl]KAJ1200558.1 hypothetical protein NDU88_004381 [Pleurodeles waltl]